MMKESGKNPKPCLRKVAAHEVVTPGGERVLMCVVEITGGFVSRCYPFSEEQPFTEWLGGTIEIVEDGAGRLQAVHCGKVIA